MPTKRTSFFKRPKMDNIYACAVMTNDNHELAFIVKVGGKYVVSYGKRRSVRRDTLEDAQKVLVYEGYRELKTA